MLVQLLQLPAFLDGYQITSECKYLCEFYCKEALGLDPVQSAGLDFSICLMNLRKVKTLMMQGAMLEDIIHRSSSRGRYTSVRHFQGVN